MQRVLGADRLLYVEVPCLDNPQRGGEKPQNADHLSNAYRTFAKSEAGLSFLGRVYRPLCFKVR